MEADRIDTLISVHLLQLLSMMCAFCERLPTCTAVKGKRILGIIFSSLRQSSVFGVHSLTLPSVVSWPEAL